MTGKSDVQAVAALRSEVECIRVVDEYQVAVAWRAARSLAERIGFRPSAIYEITIGVSELANNLVFHSARGGTVALAAVDRGGRRGLEAVAADDGPGIADVTTAMRDGFSTSGGLGGGLPGVARLMDDFEIESTVGVGTRAVAIKWL